MAAPLLLWMFLQLLALFGGRLAVHAMLAIQFIAAGMLFSYLLRDWRFTLAMFLAAGVMLALAAHVAVVPIGKCLGPWVCVGIWLTVLTFAAKLPSNYHATIIASANVLTAGGMVMCYLASEFGQNSVAFRFSPLVLTLRLLG